MQPGRRRYRPPMEFGAKGKGKTVGLEEGHSYATWGRAKVTLKVLEARQACPRPLELSHRPREVGPAFCSALQREAARSPLFPAAPGRTCRRSPLLLPLLRPGSDRCCRCRQRLCVPHRGPSPCLLSPGLQQWPPNRSQQVLSSTLESPPPSRWGCTGRRQLTGLSGSPNLKMGVTKTVGSRDSQGELELPSHTALRGPLTAPAEG